MNQNDIQHSLNQAHVSDQILFMRTEYHNQEGKKLTESIPSDVPNVFDIYGEDALRELSIEVFKGDTYICSYPNASISSDWITVLRRYYLEYYGRIKDSLSSGTTLDFHFRVIEVFLYGLLVPFRDIPLYLNRPTSYPDTLSGVLKWRLNRGI